MLYINGFITTSSKKLMESFIQISKFWRNQKNIQTNSKAWILIKLQCVIYQWTRHNELYKLMEEFIKISNSF